MPRPEATEGMPRNAEEKIGGPVFWKIAGAGASFQAGSSAVDSATIVASLVHHLTGSAYAVGLASAVLHLGWLLPQLVVGFIAQRIERRMPLYVIGAFGRASCLALIALMFAFAREPASGWVAGGFLALWTLYAFVSGIVAVPYNDIVGRSIPSAARSRMLAWRFFGGGVMALGIAAIARAVFVRGPILDAYALIFAIGAALMVVSSISFVSAGEPKPDPQIVASKRRFHDFLNDGFEVLKSNGRFRLFLYTQWLSGATLMALPFYVIAANGLGLQAEDVAILLGAQTAGSLLSNPVWGHIGDRMGKLRLLQAVGGLPLVVPLGALMILSVVAPTLSWVMPTFAILFVAVGALSNGMTIGYLGYLMEISPDEQRPAYSAYFNILASPAALLPLAGAALADVFSLQIVFAAALVAAGVQLVLYAQMSAWESDA